MKRCHFPGTIAFHEDALGVLEFEPGAPLGDHAAQAILDEFDRTASLPMLSEQHTLRKLESGVNRDTQLTC
ncbi:hypothetical protein BYZ73_01375 [Rhodovulum viride]|uniref:Uncharacterized protein n=1 Tax=Rhodovulum viride TaxID=1231134 RepID=A0ABX9DP23_9RHOB|nr:hypothetical protein BYZ73_01375 [Rhodovulum viride]